MPSTVCWHCQDCQVGWLIQQQLRQLTDIEKSTILDGFEMLLLMVMVVFEVVVVVDDTDYCMCIVGKNQNETEKKKEEEDREQNSQTSVSRRVRRLNCCAVQSFRHASFASFAAAASNDGSGSGRPTVMPLMLNVNLLVSAVESLSVFEWLHLNSSSSTDLLPTISICCQLVRVQFSVRFSVSKRSLIESAGVGSS